MQKKAVRVTLLPECRVFPVCQTIPEESVAFQEWILPQEAVQAIIKATEISTYRMIEKAVAKQFFTAPNASLIVDYIGYLRGKLERAEE